MVLNTKTVHGLALPIVLASLVLVSALIVAFLISMTTERTSSKSYAAGAKVKQLADSTVNVVMAQIKSATSGTDPTGKPLAWASQPGMIRTWNTSGKAESAYKLYSSGNTVLTGMVDAAAEANALAYWSDRPAHFTDLNEPFLGSYPILDPTAEWDGAGKGIEGFGFNPLPKGISKGQMPVEWLYVLKDGKIVAPDSSTGATKVARISLASSSNPIVGRIAFWTDDESAKVNINTASEGTYWDTPRVISTYDLKLGKYQPTRNEFQRYPGHPAMVSLKTALPSIVDAAMAYRLSPRLTDGGSRQGTVDINSATTVTLDKSRLYASPDELVFDPTRNPQGIAATDLARSLFFLTASSRAPETNLFNKPRIAMWPVHQDSSSAARSVQDRLIAFCSTINAKPYYFQRSDAASGTVDYENISRNQELFKYLRTLTSSPEPGFGGDFLTKYSADRDQILTEIFDYIRSCTNLNDQTVSKPFAPSGQVTPIYLSEYDTKGFGRFPLVQEACLAFLCQGTGKRTNTTPVTAANPVDARQYPTYRNSSDGSLTPPDDTRAVQVFLLLSFFVPSQGYCPYTPDVTVQVDGLDAFTLQSGSTGAAGMGFPNTGSVHLTPMFWHDMPWGGGIDWRSFIFKKELAATGDKRFPFFSSVMEVKLTSSGASTMKFTGGPLTVKLYAGDNTTNLVQTVKIDFPPTPCTVNVPQYPENIFRLVGAGGLQPATADVDGNNGAWPATNVCDRFDTCKSDNTPYGLPHPMYFFTSMVANDTPEIARSMVSATGDTRLLVPRNVSNTSGFKYFNTHPDWSVTTKNGAYSLVLGDSYRWAPGATLGNLNSQARYEYPLWVPAGVKDVRVNGDSTLPAGDWDNGVATSVDGPYINKPDEGNLTQKGPDAARKTPYYNWDNTYVASTATYFSPNRQIPSSGMLGSLPTGVKAQKPWRTLLFRPDPSGLHPGGGTPPDHLFMDYFWMPVVEPYPISEPFSTAGKINMNCQIMPFTYMKRETGLRAVLKSERILAVSQNDNPLRYKTNWNYGTLTPDYRLDLNLGETMKGFAERFAGNEIFRSASQICELPLVPQGALHTDMKTYWNNYKLSGDNSRERPYANIYPRLTTRSNTFTIHYRVQTLQKIKLDPSQNRWVEGKDIVTGEYRGSSTVERYIDPNESLPDYATDADAPPLDEYYRFRVVSTRQFNP